MLFRSWPEDTYDRLYQSLTLLFSLWTRWADLFAGHPQSRSVCRQVICETAGANALIKVWEAKFKLVDVPEGASVLVQIFNQKRLPAMLDPDCFLGESVIPIHLEYSCEKI